MIYLYRIYQCIIMVPLIIVATIITALLTIIGSLLGGGKWWGYYPRSFGAASFAGSHL